MGMLIFLMTIIKLRVIVDKFSIKFLFDKENTRKNYIKHYIIKHTRMANCYKQILDFSKIDGVMQTLVVGYLYKKK